MKEAIQKTAFLKCIFEGDRAGVVVYASGDDGEEMEFGTLAEAASAADAMPVPAVFLETADGVHGFCSETSFGVPANAALRRDGRQFFVYLFDQPVEAAAIPASGVLGLSCPLPSTSYSVEYLSDERHPLKSFVLNDAIILGEEHPDMVELLNRDVTFMTGNMYGAKDRRNTQDGDWQEVKLPLASWIGGGGEGKKAWGLSRHPVGKDKSGASIVLAKALGGKRTDRAIETMYAIGIDIDSGARLDETVAKLVELGIFATV